MKNLAPIGLTVYSRLAHLMTTIDALKENDLALESDLFVFSDGPRSGDEEIVASMREYLRTIEGFKSVTVTERSENSRIKNNRGGQRYLLEKYGKMIWMAEDIVPAPGFLRFLNEGLEFYKDHKDVLSITGYCLPLSIPDVELETDVFFLKRYNAWGCAIWKDRYDKIVDIDGQLLDRRMVRKLCEAGDDIPGMVRMDLRGDINALDVRAMFWQNVYDYWTVYPKRSLVQNIGFDGSGVHCGVSDRFSHENLWDKTSNFVFDDSPKANKSVLHENARFRKMPVLKRLYDQLPESLKKILKIVLLRR
jgi:hypothetical protein